MQNALWQYPFCAFPDLHTRFPGKPAHSWHQTEWLYQNACGLINPSLYEGFGIPNIEAFSQNCGVICSELPVFKEVCRDAAWYFNAQSNESLKTTLENYIENYDRVSEGISKGKVIFEELQTQNRSSIIMNTLSK